MGAPGLELHFQPLLIMSLTFHTLPQVLGIHGVTGSHHLLVYMLHRPLP